eukprot:gene12405-biopygen6346
MWRSWGSVMHTPSTVQEVCAGTGSPDEVALLRAENQRYGRAHDLIERTPNADTRWCRSLSGNFVTILRQRYRIWSRHRTAWGMIAGSYDEVYRIDE